MECKLCGLEVQSPRELVEHRRNKHMRSCTCLVCGKRSRSVSQAWRHIATHVDKVKSSDMVCDISKTQQQCNVCHKMFPSQGKKNFHLEHVHKVSDNSALTLAAQYVRIWKRFSCLVLKNSFKLLYVHSCKTRCKTWNWLSNLGNVTLTIIDLIADWDHPASSQLYSLFKKIPTQDFKRQVTKIS